ncbi:MAG: Hsp20/alpha crystallin family protein [Oscillospiraceae bacterium]
MFELSPFNRHDRSLFNFFDNFEKNFFNDFPQETAQFRTDIIDKGDKFILQAELPGFTKEDINIDLNDNYLVISAQHEENKVEDRDNFVRRERKFGTFSRSFDVSNIKTEEISAAYHDGVLELELPKEVDVPESRNKKIEIK